MSARWILFESKQKGFKSLNIVGNNRNKFSNSLALWLGPLRLISLLLWPTIVALLTTDGEPKTKISRKTSTNQTLSASI